MDQETFDALIKLNLKNISLLRIEDLEKDDERVSIARQNRSIIEFYFTSKSFLCFYIIKYNLQIDFLTYLDADLYFFDSFDSVKSEINDHSIVLTEHRFSKHLNSSIRHGKYNAGWIGVRRDKNGLACLEWWRDRCFDWCYDYIDGERYADQKYLNQIPSLFENVHILKHKGINLAPWNISQYHCYWNGEKTIVDDQPLVAFHFHGLKQISEKIFDSGFSSYQIRLIPSIKNYIYLPYLKTLMTEIKAMPIVLQRKKGNIRKDRERFEIFAKYFPLILEFLRKIKKISRILFTGTYIVYKDQGRHFN